MRHWNCRLKILSYGYSVIAAAKPNLRSAEIQDLEEFITKHETFYDEEQ
jgi:hypothetical protein